MELEKDVGNLVQKNTAEDPKPSSLLLKSPTKEDRDYVNLNRQMKAKYSSKISNKFHPKRLSARLAPGSRRTNHGAGESTFARQTNIPSYTNLIKPPTNLHEGTYCFTSRHVTDISGSKCMPTPDHSSGPQPKTPDPNTTKKISQFINPSTHQKAIRESQSKNPQGSFKNKSPLHKSQSAVFQERNGHHLHGLDVTPFDFSRQETAPIEPGPRFIHGRTFGEDEAWVGGSEKGGGFDGGLESLRGVMRVSYGT